MNQYFEHIRVEIIPLLPRFSKKIFEFGCGGGATLQHLKTIGMCEWAGGIDISETAVKSAESKGLEYISHGDLEKISININKQSLDVILCLDVLEHLQNPWLTLQNLMEYLKPGGMFICSIPNLSNYRVLLPLILFNEWKYQDEGILDRTHLRFFTEKTAIRLVKSSNLRIQNIIYTGLKKWSKSWLLNLITFGVFKRYLKFQFIISAVKLN